ncbi:unnamed protein product [Arabidopsis arenosa]|uniref:Uncharacterized protein n=1 Tax=Arabidopsis arenosa TaxID=38785 RepID=A0A8S2AZL6_ARAAE|nr:unnamed protein product [Arabidopsis arenosa]
MPPSEVVLFQSRCLFSPSLVAGVFFHLVANLTGWSCGCEAAAIIVVAGLMWLGITLRICCSEAGFPSLVVLLRSSGCPWLPLTDPFCSRKSCKPVSPEELRAYLGCGVLAAKPLTFGVIFLQRYASLNKHIATSAVIVFPLRAKTRRRVPEKASKTRTVIHATMVARAAATSIRRDKAAARKKAVNRRS